MFGGKFVRNGAFTVTGSFLKSFSKLYLMRLGALLLICVYLSLVQPFWSLLPDQFKLFEDMVKQQTKNSRASDMNNQNYHMTQNLNLASMKTAGTSEDVRHVNSKRMNATMWLRELDATGHDLACPYDWKWSLIRAEWGLTKIGCVKRFEGLRVYITVKASDVSLLPGGLLGPLSEFFRPISSTLDRAASTLDRAASILDRAASTLDRAASTFDRAGTEFSMVAKSAVLSWFVVSVLRVCFVA